MKSFNEFREVRLDEATQQAHKIGVTVSDPSHSSVSKRKEQFQKFAIVKATDKGEAQAKAEAFYKKKGYKVHDSFHHSVQPATSLKTEEVEHLDEKLDKKQDLRAALSRHEQHALDANKRGDDEAVKVHQGFINKIKTQLSKMVQNEEVEQIDEEGTPTGIKIYHTTKEGKPTHGIVFTPHDARTYEKEVKSSGGKVTHRAVMYGKTEGEKHAVKEGVEIAEDTLEEATLAQKAYKLGKFHKETGFTGPNPHKDSSADVKAAYNKGLKEEAVEEGFENLPGKATHILNKDVRHLDHGIVANGTVLRKTGEDTYEIRAGRAKGKIAKIGKDHVNKLEEGHVPAERNRPDLSAGDKDKLGKLAALIAKEKAKKAAKQVNETAYEKDMDDKKPVVAHGVKGMKSTPFSKKFKSMAHYEKWADSEDAGNHEVHRVVQEEVEQIDELKKSTLGSYIKKASSQAAEAGAAGDELSAGQKAEKNKPEAGSKMYALRRKREAGVQTAMGKLTKEDVEQIDEKLTDDAKKKIQTALGRNTDGNMLRKTSGPAKALIGLAKTNPANVKEETEMSQMDQYLAAISGNADFRSALEEKKLTPAEMKKREEIAQAIERENPGIDMGKKMAIATAQAKKVAEEVVEEEQIDEISKMTAREYLNKAGKQIDVGIDNKEKREKRIDGYFNASARLADMKPTSWRHKSVKEEVELEEGAHEHYMSGYKAQGEGKNRQHNPYKEDSLAAKYWAKGWEHASDKKEPMKFSEEVDLDEAISDLDKQSMKKLAAYARPEVERSKDVTRKYATNGEKGARNIEHGFRSAIKRQYKKMDEEAELEEGYNELTKRAPLRMKVAAAQKMKGDTPDNEKEKSLAKLAKPYDKVTHADVLKGRGVTKEGVEMKSYSQLMAELEEAKKDDYWDFKDLPKETSSGVRKVAGTRYGGASQKDEPENDEEGKEEPAKRGRPAGSKSGARR